MNFGAETAVVAGTETTDVKVLLSTSTSSNRLRANSQEHKLVHGNSLRDGSGSAVVEVYFKDLNDSSKYFNLNDSSKDDLLIQSSPLKRTSSIRSKNSINLLSSRVDQQERHAKIKVSGKAAMDVPQKDWHGIVNFAGKPRYDLHLKKEYYPPPCKDADLIQLRTMKVKYGVNGVISTGGRNPITTVVESEEQTTVNETPNSRDQQPKEHKGHDRDDQSWGDSTIEEILGPMNFKSPPLKGGAATGGGIDGDQRPPSAMNDDLPRTPGELCEVMGIDPTVALDLTDHPGFNNNNRPDFTSPLLSMQQIPSLR